jgi:hypothetical protein
MFEVSIDSGFAEKKYVNIVLEHQVQNFMSFFHVAEIESIDYVDFQVE